MAREKETQASREKERSEFKVTDRRHFTASGERRMEFSDEEHGSGEASAFTSSAAGQPPSEAQAGFERRPLEEPEGVDFTMLVNAMAQPALLFLGEIPHPSTGQKNVDLEQARIQIDLLGMLHVKCRGNLTSQEEGLLERVLYELRMLYVARTGKTD